MTGRNDAEVIAECDRGGVCGRAHAELGLNFAGGQGTPASNVNDPRAHMLYASGDQERVKWLSPL